MFEMNDTIAAISSATGTGSRGIVRMSGPDALALAGKIFSPAGTHKNLQNQGGFTFTDGLVKISQYVEFPGRIYVFRSPASYTRQDIVEFHVPGGPACAAAVHGAMLSLGARNARAGEFTARAFLSGRIDLSQAQAVADVIAAGDDAHLRASVAVLGGKLFKICRRFADEVATALALVEASIDLAEEDISLADPQKVEKDLRGLAGGIRELEEQSGDMPDLAHCPQVVIAGRPNVGKSSLLNTLCGSDRAIISDLAGTTRDVLRSQVTLPCGAAVDLIDVAGFGITGDALHDHAGAAARNAVAQADLLLFVIDSACGFTAENSALLCELDECNETAEIICVCNKSDIARGEINYDVKKFSAVVHTSAVSGAGLDELKAAITRTLDLATLRGGEELCLHGDQRRALLAAAAAAERAANILHECLSLADAAELVAVELRETLAELGSISGEIVTEDILGRIFSQFCVGK